MYIWVRETSIKTKGMSLVHVAPCVTPNHKMVLMYVSSHALELCSFVHAAPQLSPAVSLGATHLIFKGTSEQIVLMLKYFWGTYWCKSIFVSQWNFVSSFFHSTISFKAVHGYIKLYFCPSLMYVNCINIMLTSLCLD